MTTPEAFLTDIQGQVVATISPTALVTFGRDPSNALVLDDFSVSPQHGAIAFRGGAFVVERWSRGNVWINSHNHPVEGSRMLQDNDRVLIGNRHAFIFHLKPSEAATTVNPPPSAPQTVVSPPPSPPEAPLTMTEGDVGSPAAPSDEEAHGAAHEMSPFPMIEDAPAAVASLKADEADAGDNGPAREEPPSARLDTGFMPAWARGDDDGHTPEAPADTPPGVEIAAPEATVVDAPAPPAPVPDWASQPARSADLTPPEGVNIPPAGWEQELHETPPPQVRATTDDEVWTMRQRSEARRLIQEAIQMLRQGSVERARQKLNQALRLNESNEDAWLWLAAAEQDPDRRRGALQRVLTINPSNVTADWGLINMQVHFGPPAKVGPAWQETPPSTAPGAAYPPSSPPTSEYYYTPVDDTLAGTSPITDSIPALLRQDEAHAGRGRAWAARVLGFIGLVMLAMALFLPYGIWRIEEFALWGEIPPLGEPWAGLQVWGFVAIGVMAFAALMLLLIRATGRTLVGVLLTITGLAVIFMAVLPILFGIVTEPQAGAVVWGAAGLPLMLAGLLKIW